LERVAAPGEKFLYWNEGYTILGEVVGKVSGLGYREFVGRRVLTPLGMSRSGFWSKNAIRRRLHGAVCGGW